MSILSGRAPVEELPRPGGDRRRLVRDRGRIDHQHHRPQWRRQVDDVQPDHRLSAADAPARSAFQDKRITGMATNRIAELGVARAFQIARPFRDLSVFENVRIGALFGKAGPRDVDATTQRGMELAAIASPRRAAGQRADGRPAAPSRSRPRHRHPRRPAAGRRALRRPQSDRDRGDDRRAAPDPRQRRHGRAGRARHAVGHGSLRPRPGARRRPPDRRRLAEGRRQRSQGDRRLSRNARRGVAGTRHSEALMS